MSGSELVTKKDDDESSPKPKLWYPRAVVYDPLKAGSIDGTDTEPHDKAVWRAMNATYYPNSKVKGIPENTVFVGRLNKNVTDTCLYEEFSQFGTIKRCRVVEDIVTGFSLGYAFIEFEREKDAHAAVAKGDGMYLAGKRVIVDHECERLLPGWVPRRLGGGFGGKKESGQLRFGGKERPFAKPVHLMREWEVKKKVQQQETAEKPEKKKPRKPY